MLVTAVFAMALVVAGASGCSSKAMPAASQGSGSPAMVGSAMNTPSTAKLTAKQADATKCSACAGEGMAPMVEGSVQNANGVQVVAVGIKNGYYSPNVFVAKAGQPVSVVFTGKATECLAHPTFKTLKKTVDIEKTASGTIDLGTLPPGTYEFGCKMGMVGGKIVVQ